MVVDSLSPCVLDPQDDTCDSGFKCVPIAKPAMLTSPVAELLCLILFKTLLGTFYRIR